MTETRNADDTASTIRDAVAKQEHQRLFDAFLQNYIDKAGKTSKLLSSEKHATIVQTLSMQTSDMNTVQKRNYHNWKKKYAVRVVEGVTGLYHTREGGQQVLEQAIHAGEMFDKLHEVHRNVGQKKKKGEGFHKALDAKYPSVPRVISTQFAKLSRQRTTVARESVEGSARRFQGERASSVGNKRPRRARGGEPRVPGGVEGG